MDPSIAAAVARQSALYVDANLEGLTDEDGRVAVPNGGNSMNWLLGHIVYWRCRILEIVGASPVWTADEGAQYRGSPGAPTARPSTFDPTTAYSLERLTADFGRSQQRLVARLAAVGPDRLCERQGGDGVTVGDTALALLGHEMYHAGQLGVLRRMAGKGGTL